MLSSCRLYVSLYLLSMIVLLRLSIMNDVFKTPELIAHIFSCAEKQTSARCARVCKDWMDAALSAVWVDMTDIRPLFQILGPIIPVGICSLMDIQ